MLSICIGKGYEGDETFLHTPHRLWNYNATQNSVSINTSRHEQNDRHLRYDISKYKVLNKMLDFLFSFQWSLFVGD